MAGTTPAQLAVTARLVAYGWSNREIAQDMGITETAVKLRFGRIFDIAGVDSRVHLIRFFSERPILRELVISETSNAKQIHLEGVTL